MPWGRLDDGLYDHPKLDRLGPHRLAAVGLWTLCISWCNRRLTDGVVPSNRIRLLGGTVAIAEVLVEAEMFDRHPDGYMVHDFLTFNESRSDVESRRESDRKRKRKPGDLPPDDRMDSGRKPRGVHPDSGGFPDGIRPETKRPPSGPPARAGSRPGPSRPTGLTGLDSSGGARADDPVDPSADDDTSVPWLAGT